MPNRRQRYAHLSPHRSLSLSFSLIPSLIQKVKNAYNGILFSPFLPS
ncbi:hypothetical protein HMPREF3226_00836 [Prevotella corporis]|uniref:Uncharacterized protein n=1 Tax=Prevotella corporis TaxID=28128 RepID=A0A133QF55_9BACT|nr:hypothetical protein HMPREF3226_00836 [Prevotella corporis]